MDVATELEEFANELNGWTKQLGWRASSVKDVTADGIGLLVECLSDRARMRIEEDYPSTSLPELKTRYLGEMMRLVCEEEGDIASTIKSFHGLVEEGENITSLPDATQRMMKEVVTGTETPQATKAIVQQVRERLIHGLAKRGMPALETRIKDREIVQQFAGLKTPENRTERISKYTTTMEKRRDVVEKDLSVPRHREAVAYQYQQVMPYIKLAKRVHEAVNSPANQPTPPEPPAAKKKPKDRDIGVKSAGTEFRGRGNLSVADLIAKMDRAAKGMNANISLEKARGVAGKSAKSRTLKKNVGSGSLSPTTSELQTAIDAFNKAYNTFETTDQSFNLGEIPKAIVEPLIVLTDTLNKIPRTEGTPQDNLFNDLRQLLPKVFKSYTPQQLEAELESLGVESDPEIVTPLPSRLTEGVSLLEAAKSLQHDAEVGGAPSLGSSDSES